MSDLALLFNIDDIILAKLAQIKQTRSDGPYYEIVKLLNSVRTSLKRQLPNQITSAFVRADVDEIKKLESFNKYVGTLAFDWEPVKKLTQEAYDYLDAALISVHANILRQKRNLIDPFAPEQKPIKHLVNITKDGGRGYNSTVKNYANLVLDTTSSKARTVAVVRRAKLSKLGLTEVKNSDSIPESSCDQYVGKIYSVDDSHPEYPLLSTLPNGGPPFHPYCKKRLGIYLGE